MNKNIIDEFLKRPIAFHPIVAQAFGSIKLGILWCQLNYWKNKTKDPDGWIYKTQEDMYEETAMSRKNTDTARELGEKIGVLECKRMGKTGVVHYRINFERSIEIFQKFIASKEKQPALFHVKQVTKNTADIEYLSKIPPEDMAELCQKNSVSQQFVIKRAEDVINYCERKGKTYRDYKAALRSFIVSHLEDHPEEKQRYTRPEQKKEEKNEEDPRMKRTPDEQARINKAMATMKESLKNNFAVKKS